MRPQEAQVNAQAVTRYLSEVDSSLPGLVSGLYLTGSSALGDFHASSDVDFVAVVTRELGSADLDGLAQVHARLPERPYMDGVYLTAAQFNEQPADGRAAPHSLDGQFHRGGETFQLNPITWAELAQDAITVRGPEPAVTVDPARLREWNANNLREYWQPFVAQCRTIMAEREKNMPLPYPESLPWLVTGPPRLHLTITTGEIASKTRSAWYAAALFPEWAELVEKALAVRNGADVRPTVADMIDAADLADLVIKDALSKV
jgi:hypothetical protein